MSLPTTNAFLTVATNPTNIDYKTPADVIAELNPIISTTIGNGAVISESSVLSAISGAEGDVLTITAGVPSFQPPTSGGGGSWPGIYVSQLVGNDITGDGTIGNPYATIAKGILEAGAPADPVVIYVIDGATYDENLFINKKVYIEAPYASLIPSAGPYAIRFDLNTQYKINFKLITGPGGLGGVGVESVNNGNIFLNCNEYYGKTNAGDAWFHINVNNIGGDMDGQAGKIIGYCTVNVATVILGGTVTICQPTGIPIV